MAIIGDGPAAILLARMRHELGYAPDATVIIGKARWLGGIWNHERVVDEGHNTFATASAFGAQLPTKFGRDGQELVDFLSEVAEPIQGNLEQGNVTGVEFDSTLGKYRVLYKRGNVVVASLADSVCICTGCGVPAPLSSHSMKTNAEDIQGLGKYMKRWQEQLDDSEEFEGQNPLLVGLGNSTIGMIRQLVEFASQGTDVVPLILTHHTRNALLKQNVLFGRQDGKLDGPLGRTPSNLSKLALDIDDVRDSFKTALDNGWIIDSVSRWDVDGKLLRKKKICRVRIETRRRMTHEMETNRIYALIGYRNDPDVMRALGCAKVSNEGYVQYDPVTHRVSAAFPNDPRRLYIMGAAASLPHNRNEELIPGMMSVVGRIALAEIIAGHRRMAGVGRRILDRRKFTRSRISSVLGRF